MTTPPQSPRAHLRAGHCDYCTRQLPHPPKTKPLTRELIAWRARNRTV